MKLKTLKDFRTRSVMVFNCPDETDYDIIEADNLKQEAIKWIKEFDRLPLPINELEHQKFLNNFVFNNDTHYAIKDWIKHFFNITEEDLNDTNKTN